MALSCDLRICGSCRFNLSHICHTEQYFLMYNYILIIDMLFLHPCALYQWFRRRCSIGLARNRTCHNSWVFTIFCLSFIASYLELHVLFIFLFDCKFACSTEKKRTSIVLYKYMQPWMHSISSTYCQSNSVLQLSFSCLLLMKNCTWNGLLICKNLTFFIVLEAFLSFIGNWPLSDRSSSYGIFGL